MFENKRYRTIYYSRIIMSWVRAGGTFDKHGEGYDRFKSWLESLIIDSEHIPEEVIDEIMFLAMNGKMELEDDAKKFMLIQIFND